MQKELPELFFITPPGCTELAEMGYINIPKIFKDPPLELTEVQSFEDEAWGDAGPSNFWVLRSAIQDKKAAFDDVVPLFPDLIRYAIPWVVCEYGLFCATNPNPDSLKEFTRNTIGRWMEDYLIVASALGEKRWRDAKNPIHYLRVVAKRKKDAEHREKTIERKRAKIEVVEPLISGLEDYEEYWRQSGILGKLIDDHSPQDHLEKLELRSILQQSCLEVGLENLVEYLATQFDTCSSFTEILSDHGFEGSEYERLKKQLQRHKPLLKKAIERKRGEKLS